MKIAIGYPPIESAKGVPLLSQNRQFQFFNSPTFIYPMVPAFAATMLHCAGHKVYWMDGIAERKKFNEWFFELKSRKIDILMIEAKTPIIKTYWKIINQIKKEIPKLKIVLVGDHVTQNPLESFENSKVDYVLTGGDYDFLMVNLVEHITNNEKLEGSVYWRENDELLKSQIPKSKFQINSKFQNSKTRNKVFVCSSGYSLPKHDIDKLPFIDRKLTKWQLYAFKNGNYKYTPATYMYSGRDCWWGKCTFCVWDQVLYPHGSYRSFTADRLFAEVKYLVDNFHVKEIFDDAGSFFVGYKLEKFCRLMIESGYNKKVRYGCNMKFGMLKQKDYNLMKQAGFRFILFGMESANQKTLDEIHKGNTVQDIEEGAKMASRAGLDVHATIMLGYPWESEKDIQNTIKFAKNCFAKGYFNTMQATIVIPYPGTELYKQCVKNKWLLTTDYDDYDMRGPVMKTPYDSKKLTGYVRELYTSFMTPKYVLRQLLKIRNFDDVKFYLNAGRKLAGHLLDFS